MKLNGERSIGPVSFLFVSYTREPRSQPTGPPHPVSSDKRINETARKRRPHEVDIAARLAIRTPAALRTPSRSDWRIHFRAVKYAFSVVAAAVGYLSGDSAHPAREKEATTLPQSMA